MDYKRKEIREDFEKWIMQQVRHDDEVIKNLKVAILDFGSKRYMKTLNHIMSGCFKDNSKYIMDELEACEWIGTTQMVFDIQGFCLENGEDAINGPKVLVTTYVNLVGEEIAKEWMAKPQHSFDH